MSVLEPGSETFVDDHVAAYLATAGYEGHYLSLAAYGGVRPNTSLILKTKGRNTGATRLVPLIYDNAGPEYTIIASTSGGARHPGWYLNLLEQSEVEFQVADKCFRASWRIAEGVEREAVWARMAAAFPPYDDYVTRTTRRIPVVLLLPTASIDSL